MSELFSLKDKNIIVTGASSGIGKAVSILAADLGANIILIGRNIQKLKDTIVLLPESRHIYFSLDITDFDSLEKTIKTAVNQVGTIHGFVHSAGIEKTLPLQVLKPKIFKEIFETNVFAGFELARIISKKNIVDPSGASFVFISSVMGKLGEVGKIAYCSSKSALLSGVKAMALELADKKIRCNCILPGIVETEMVKGLFESISNEAKDKIISKHPLGIGQPEDVASIVCFCLSNLSKWITGSEYIIDGGYSAQ